MRHHVRLLCAGLAALTLGALLSGCTGDSKPEHSGPASPPPVTLAASHTPKGLKIGVLVSLTSPPGQGADWAQAANGARLAAWRFEQGGEVVNLQAFDDKGDAASAVTGVDHLADNGASAIVLATTGNHLANAVAEAKKRSIPVILPYCWQGLKLTSGVWCTGASPQGVRTALTQTLAQAKAKTPVAVVAEGTSPPEVKTTQTIQVPSGTDAPSLTKTLHERLTTANADAVVIAGPATQQAAMAAAVQGTGLDLPMVFTPEATSPVFGSALAASGASQAGTFMSVGAATGDSVALDPDDDGRAMSAFLAADRTAAGDSSVKSLFGDQAFGSVAYAADVASHDAVVSIVRAAAAAKSTDPEKIAAELGKLTVTHSDGLAGPRLEFSTPQALADFAVVQLRATSIDNGLRPAADQGAGDSTGAGSARLSWYTG